MRAGDVGVDDRFHKAIKAWNVIFLNVELNLTVKTISSAKGKILTRFKIVTTQKMI